MTKEELFDEITKWEVEVGESFNDYFSHDSISDSSWAFWILGKGFNVHANEIIKQILTERTCIDQEILYNIFPVYDENDNFIEENYDKNLMLLSEFLVSTPYYLKMVTEWFDNKAWK